MQSVRFCYRYSYDFLKHTTRGHKSLSRIDNATLLTNLLPHNGRIHSIVQTRHLETNSSDCWTAELGSVPDSSNGFLADLKMMADSENLLNQLEKLEIEFSNCEMEIKAASANVLSTTGDIHAYWMREKEALRRKMEFLWREESLLLAHTKVREKLKDTFESTWVTRLKCYQK